MPEYVRSLIVILVVGTATFYFFKPGFTGSALSIDAFNLRRNSWILITLSAFLAVNFWVFVFVLVFILGKIAKRETNKIALFFFLVLALPQIKAEIPGFAGVRYLLSVDYLKVVTIILLLPICFKNFKNRHKHKSSFILPDALLFGYYIWQVVLHFHIENLTGEVRDIIELIIDIFIPYYAISRGVKRLEELKEIMASFALIGLVVSSIAIIEFSRSWLLYGSLLDALNLDPVLYSSPGYLLRGNNIRAVATSGHSIVLGYVLVVAIGTYISIKSSAFGIFKYWVGLALLLIGEVATLAKGPWLGLLVLTTVFVVTGLERTKKIFYMFIAFAIITGVLISTDAGEKIISYLPIVGKLDEGSYTYRKLLFEKSINLIADSPWVGVENPRAKLIDLRQGQGIVDIVNMYLAIALNFGIIGLSLFVGYFLVVLRRVHYAYSYVHKNETEKDGDFIGQALMAILLAVLMIISTVSPIFQVTITYVIFSSLALAYHNLKVYEKQAFMV